MNRLLILILLAGTAFAQLGASAFSTDPHTPSSPIDPPSAPAATFTRGSLNGLPDLLPQPRGKATLMGGTVLKIDRVRDEMTLHLFGGGKTRILFDARTHVYRDGSAAPLADLQNGSRVYVDTVLAGVDIFAQNIRLRTEDATAQSSAQVVTYDPRSGILVLNDTMSPRQLKLRVWPTTEILREGKTVSPGNLVAGELVSVTFLPNTSGKPAARTITILAAPGSKFVFVGRVVHLDLHLGLLVVVDPRNQKYYEITFDPNVVGVSDRLREGATVEAVTRFDGGRYLASAITVNPELH
ncbi:MAG: hypothetical protein WAL32_06125 [Terriglobales bacterium]